MDSMKDLEPKRLGRNAAAVLLSTVAILPACGPDQSKSLPPTRSIVASAEAPRLNLLSPQEIERHTTQWYPELKGKAPSESGSFKTSEGTPIIWLNYTDGRFNEEAAKTMFSFIREGALSPSGPTKITYEGKEESFTFGPRSFSKEKPIFIVTENAQLPSYIGADAFGGTWFENQEGEALVSFVRYIGNPADRDLSNKDDTVFYLFASEVCLQTTLIESSNKELEGTLQTQFCRSIGAIYSSRQKGLSYQAYARKFQGLPIFTGFNFLIFSETTYNKIPKTGKILTSNSLKSLK